jgi:hypothetical protein
VGVGKKIEGKGVNLGAFERLKVGMLKVEENKGETTI